MKLPSSYSCVCAGLLAGLAFACAQPGAAQTTGPVAIVYVSHIQSNQAGSPHVVTIYSADSSGRLTQISGSPFTADVESMAVTGKYLFGNSSNGQFINTFLVASNGAIKQVDSFNAQKYTPGECQQPIDVVLDHTGATLYAFSAFYGTDPSCPTEPVYQSFQINKSNGALTFLGNTNSSQSYSFPLRFSVGDIYAYEASAKAIYGFKRQSNGDLVYYDTTTHMPTPPAGHTYTPIYAAADPFNHVGVILQDTTSSATYPNKIATYTQNSSGYLTTTSTASNMPSMVAGAPYYSQMAPSGKLIAVSGSGGLQVFHFNGANPATHYTGPLTPHQVDEMFWDNANHLYAIDRLDNRLYVFTVTPTSYSQAPGSPYTLNAPAYLIVQPK